MEVYVVVGSGENERACSVFSQERDAENYLDLLIAAGLQNSYYRKCTIDSAVMFMYAIPEKGENNV